MVYPSAGIRQDRPMLVFTDESGAVVLIEDDLAQALGYDNPDDAVGDPLAATLGLATGQAVTRIFPCIVGLSLPPQHVSQ